VASSAPRVRLLLNGQVVAEGKVDPIDMASFDVPYAAGVLEAVALRDGVELARDRVETSGSPASTAIITREMESTLTGPPRDPHRAHCRISRANIMRGRAAALSAAATIRL